MPKFITLLRGVLFLAKHFLARFSNSQHTTSSPSVPGSPISLPERERDGFRLHLLSQYHKDSWVGPGHADATEGNRIMLYHLYKQKTARTERGSIAKTR